MIRWSDDGGAVTGRLLSRPSPTSAGSAIAAAIAPAISAAARTRVHVLLMFPPYEADNA
jgi:hypothetical protein